MSSRRETRILRRIVDLAASEMDLKRVLNEVVRIVTEISGADSVFIYLFEPTHRRLTLMASKVPHRRMLGRLQLRLGEGITGWVAQQNEPVAIPRKAYDDPRFKHFDLLPEDRYEAFLSVPIVYKGKVSGVINVQHRTPRTFPRSTVTLLETIAKQVGGIIVNARLYEETKIKAVQFDSLVRVSRSITSQAYLDEILNLIVVVTAEMLDSKICSILLVDDRKGRELVIRATQSLSEAYRGKPNLKVSDSLLGGVVRSRRPLVVADVRREKRYAYRDLAEKEGLTSMVAVPMIVRDRAIGVICVYTKEEHHFSPEEIGILQIVADQAAVAVDNTRLMEDALKAKEALEVRKLVERAKGILMRMSGLSEDAAHRLLHKKSMDSCRSMKEIAESVILLEDLQKGGSPAEPSRRSKD